MKYFFLVLILFTSLSLFAQSDSNLPQRRFKLPKNAVAGKDYEPNTVIVKFKHINLQAFALTSSLSTTSTLLSKPLRLKSVSINQVKQLFPKYPNAAKGTVDTIGLERIVEIKYSSNAGIEKVINEFLKDPNVQYAEPHYFHHTFPARP